MISFSHSSYCYIDRLPPLISWFCILHYHWNWIVSRNFLLKLFRSAIHNNMVPASRYNLTPSFSISIWLKSFSWAIAVSRTSTTIWKLLGVSGQSYDIHDSSGIALSFSQFGKPMSMILTHIEFICRSIFILIIFFLGLFYEGILKFIKDLFCT